MTPHRRSALALTLALAASCAPSPAHPPTSPRPPFPDAGPPDPRGDCSLDGLSQPIASALDAQWGSWRAPVLIVLFSDFECPFCARCSELVDRVRARHGPERVRVVWKHTPLPMHRMARPAAEAAEAVRALAGHAAFWGFHDRVFAHQRELSPASLRAWAAEAGVFDLAAFERALDEGAPRAKVAADLRLAVELGVRATPTLVVNGALIEGTPDDDALLTFVDAELTRADGAPPGHACRRMTESWSKGPP